VIDKVKEPFLTAADKIKFKIFEDRAIKSFSRDCSNMVEDCVYSECDGKYFHDTKKYKDMGIKLLEPDSKNKSATKIICRDKRSGLFVSKVVEKIPHVGTFNQLVTYQGAFQLPPGGKYIYAKYSVLNHLDSHGNVTRARPLEVVICDLEKKIPKYKNVELSDPLAGDIIKCVEKNWEPFIQATKPKIATP
jgi:hypothetical protein